MLKLKECVLLICLISSYFSQIEGMPKDEGYETFTEVETKKYPEVEEISLCENATLDAFIMFKDETGYAFRGPYFWKVVKDQVEKDYSLKIYEHWKGLPDYIDAAFLYHEKIIFFKGPKYWRFTGKKMDEGYPKLIKYGFPGIPDDIQAVTAWGEKDFIYFFKDEYYWRYEPHCEHSVKKTYPKLISEVFLDVPCHIDVALGHPTDGFLYFFKGIRFYKFDHKNLRVDFEKEKYPLPSAPHWFGCKALA